MSWTDRLKNIVFTITTGDGKQFYPLWKGGETEKEYNSTVFEFINLDGALVDRKKAGPRRFPLVFWFTGESHIDQAEEFSASADDSRAWKINHPWYGDISGQPLRINRNNIDLNVTEVSVDFLESVAGVFPKSITSVIDVTQSNYEQLLIIMPEEYAAKVALKPVDVATVTDLGSKITAFVNDKLDALNYAEFQLAANAMFASIDKLILAPFNAIRSIGFVLAIPAKFALGINTRLTMLSAVFNSFKDLLGLKPTRNNKALFEAGCSEVLSAMCLALVNPAPGDYLTRVQVTNAAAVLSVLYNDYLTILDEAYLPDNDTSGAFTAGVATQQQLQGTIITTIANLNSLAFAAKQERVATLDKDSNLVLLTHKYMGLDAEDANIEQFRQINNIKNKSLFLVKKGKQIIYYV